MNSQGNDIVTYFGDNRHYTRYLKVKAVSNVGVLEEHTVSYSLEMKFHEFYFPWKFAQSVGWVH